MTIRKIIELFDDMKPNAYSDEQKLRWIAALDGKIAADLMQLAPQEIQKYFNYPYPKGLEVEPMVSFPHDDIYSAWLTAQVDYADEEYAKYNGSMVMYKAIYDDFKLWFLQTYDPAQQGG